jgi:hypothetical protein
MTRLAATVLLGALLFAAGPNPGHAQPAAATGSLRGRVSDEPGAAIFRGFVLVHGGPKGESRQLQLNENGEFDVQLAPGLYDFFVGSIGFIPFAKGIKIQPDKPVVLKVKLRVDMEHIEMTAK